MNKTTLGSDPFFVGVHIGDPNLATLPQIAPVSLKVRTSLGATVIIWQMVAKAR